MKPQLRYRDWLRNGLYLICLAGAAPWLLYRLWSQPRRRIGLRQKLFGLPRRPLNGAEGAGPTIWFHGVSVGEIQLLAPLVQQVKQQLPGCQPVISATTASGMELARRLMPDYPAFFFPLDFSWAVRRTLEGVAPQLLVLGELELWPNLIAEASRRQIPVAVVNARLGDKSFAGYRRARLVCRGMFQRLSLVAAQTPEDAERFRQCGCPPQRVVVTGNTKFDNVEFDRACAQVRQLRHLTGLTSGYRVLIAGSTQPPEELVAARALQRLLPSFPNLRLIVVPRHPDRFDEVWEELRTISDKVIRRSRLHEPAHPDDWHILLVDTVGELRWWWGLADIALVGGSFGDRGGQNMLEPAAYGANVLFGPHTFNFRYITRMLLEHDAARVIPALDAVEDVLREELQDPATGRQRGERARRLVAAQQGAIARTVRELLRLLPHDAADCNLPPLQPHRMSA